MKLQRNIYSGLFTTIDEQGVNGSSHISLFELSVAVAMCMPFCCILGSLVFSLH